MVHDPPTVPSVSSHSAKFKTGLNYVEMVIFTGMTVIMGEAQSRVRVTLYKYPNHVTSYYVQPCIPVDVQWVKAYAELNLT